MQLTIVTLEGRGVKTECYNFRGNLWKHIQCYNIISYLKDEKKIPAAVSVQVKLKFVEVKTQFTVAGIVKEGG